MSTTTKVQYRIMSKKPGKRKWEYLSFTGAQSDDLDLIKKRFQRVTSESPGWTFRIEQRTVVTTATAWEVRL